MHCQTQRGNPGSAPRTNQRLPRRRLSRLRIGRGQSGVRSVPEKHKLQDKVVVCGTGCLGPCATGPIVLVDKDDVFYERVTLQDVEEIVEKHIIGGKVVERLSRKNAVTGQPIVKINDIDFFKKQMKIVRRNGGLIDPGSIEDYFGVEGYQGLAKALSSLTPEQVIEEMLTSGLRGRGGAGFPPEEMGVCAEKSGEREIYSLQRRRG